MTSRHHSHDGLFSTRVHSEIPIRYNRLLIACCAIVMFLSGCWDRQKSDHLPDEQHTSNSLPEICKQQNAITAEVVALEQIITFNRFGAFNPAGMVYALRQDVVYDDPETKNIEEQIPLPDSIKLDDVEFAKKIAGRVKLRNDKRPRPLVLRVHEGECIQVKFWNLLSPLPTVHTSFKRADFPGELPDGTKLPDGGVQRHAVLETPADNPEKPNEPKAEDISTPPRCFDKDGNKTPNSSSCDSQFPNLFPFPRQEEPDYPTTRSASIHVNGLDYLPIRPEICNELDKNGLENKTDEEKKIIKKSCAENGKNMGADGANVGKNANSLVEPGKHTTYIWYARQEGGYFMYSAGALAGGEGDGGQLGLGLFGSINVEPKESVWYRSQVKHCDLVKAAGGQCDDKMVDQINDYSHVNYDDLAIIKDGVIQHSDLNAIIYQTDKTSETPEVCSKRSPGSSCGMSFREFTTIFHDENKVFQAFAELSDEGNPISSIADGMAINYGASGAGSAVLAAKKKIGPGRDCPECKLEEFFLSSWVNGDPAMIVQRDMEGKAVKALYPDDPSNVHHSYLGDPVRFRNIHAGPKETHVFHLHAHQWLQDQNDPNANYLDSQTISPGSSYTYDIQYGGGGNRNLTVGDAIFHCHLYPHFAAGMWELWRNHDVFEDGMNSSEAQQSNSPDYRSRSLPDYEIKGGTPNPAIVPIPGFPLAPLPTKEVRGYPFFMEAVPGHRPPQPPLDMALKDPKNPAAGWLDGGLPRHIITKGHNRKFNFDDPKNKDANELIEGKGDRDANEASRYVAKRTWVLNSDKNNLILANEVESADLKILPQCGAESEILAMAYHAGWDRDTINGLKNGIPPKEMIDPIKNEPNTLWKACKDDFKKALAKLPDSFQWNLKAQDTSWPINRLIHGDPKNNDLITMKPLWEGKGYETPIATHPNGLTPSTAYSPGDKFRINGFAPAQGAPFAEPCPKSYHEHATDKTPGILVNRDDPRLYKSAYIQFDMTVNKYGWHDPQARMPVLEEDAAATIDGTRLAEPLFFRANSGDCIQFQATNLIPSVLNLDDFQVYTPTDTIGQHIHLVKFDVTSSDGSANGWNYEDGTFSPDEVRERIKASQQGDVINDWDGQPHAKLEWANYKLPKGSPHTDMLGKCSGSAEDNNKNHPWCGAQATVQRWWADPVLNNEWEDRTMRAVFTHDHYGPSSHQQHGFYGALIVEPKETVWTKLSASPADVDTDKPCDPSTLSGFIGKPCRDDGGPTSYAANIGLPKNHHHKNDAEHQHLITREYDLAFADFAILYNADLRPVNPPSRQADLMLPYVVRDGLKPKPEGISTEDPGTRLLNYRNEPIPMRIAEEDHSDDEKNNPSSLEYHQKTTFGNGKGAVKTEGDMANVFSSLTYKTPEISQSSTNSEQYASNRIKKLTENVPNEIIDADELKALLVQQVDKTKNFNTRINEEEPWRLEGDPSTPLLAGYAGDSLNIQLIQGAQEEQHVFSANGLIWKAEPKSKNSGYMNGQQIGISEHFEMEVKLPPPVSLTDYWFGSPSVENYWDGMWGLVRSMGGHQVFLPDVTVHSATGQQVAANEPNRFYRKEKLIGLFTPYLPYFNDREKIKSTDTANVEDKVEKILNNLAVLPKNLGKTNQDIPDLHALSKTDLEVDFDSNSINKKLLDEFSKDPENMKKIISKLEEKYPSGLGDYLYYKGWKKLSRLWEDEQAEKDALKPIKEHYDYIYDTEIGNLQPCPYAAYSESNKHMRHVAAVLAEDLLKDGKQLDYNKTFNITDKQGIVFVELDSEWVSEQLTEAKNVANKLMLASVSENDATLKSNSKGDLGKDPQLVSQKIIDKLQKDYQNGRVIEPLVLRASAGECIQVTLHNLLPEQFLNGTDDSQNSFNFWSYNLMPPIVSGFNFNQVQMSSTISLTPQLVAYDVSQMGGGNIGINKADDPASKAKGLPGCRKINPDGKPDFSACDNNIAKYIWYAGKRQELDIDTYKKYERELKLAVECPVEYKMDKGEDNKPILKGYLCYTPIEFGVTSIRSFGDVIKQSSHGAVGALVIEPKDSTVTFPDSSSRVTADIKWKDKDGKDKSFREFVTVFQDDLSLHQNGQPMPNHRMADDAEDTGQKGFNYHTEPLWARNGMGTSGADFNTLNRVNYTNTLSSIYPNPGCGAKPNSVCGDPETPVFKAKAGSDIRIRLVHPNGHSRQHAFALYGHNWDYQPWKNESTEIATPEEKEVQTARVGAIGGIGPGRHFNIVTKAGGVNGVTGDYLFRVQENFQFHGGMWGILRVEKE